MYPLLESIYLRDGNFRNLPYHERRVRKTQLALFNIDEPIQLIKVFSSLNIPPSGLFKVRLMYDVEIRKVEFIPYVARTVRSIKLIHSDTIKYDYKYLDRKELTTLYEQRGEADEILIVKNGFITDASYANVIFKKSGVWYTPQHCLLPGTMRQFLLDTKRIQEAVIDSRNYKHYESIKLINSMLAMEEAEIPVKSLSE